MLYKADSVSNVRVVKQFGRSTIQIKYNYGGDEFVSTSVRVLPNDSTAVARAFKKAGYMVYSMEYDIEKGIGVSYDIEEGKNASKNVSAFDMKKLNEF